MVETAKLVKEIKQMNPNCGLNTMPGLKARIPRKKSNQYLHFPLKWDISIIHLEGNIKGLLLAESHWKPLPLTMNKGCEVEQTRVLALTLYSTQPPQELSTHWSGFDWKPQGARTQMQAGQWSLSQWVEGWFITTRSESSDAPAIRLYDTLKKTLCRRTGA